jgi:hypothetical protein
MANWHIVRVDDPEAGREPSRLRVHPEAEPERWIFATNPNLPPETQQEFAHLIAEFLSTLL